MTDHQKPLKRLSPFEEVGAVSKKPSSEHHTAKETMHPHRHFTGGDMLNEEGKKLLADHHTAKETMHPRRHFPPEDALAGAEIFQHFAD